MKIFHVVLIFLINLSIGFSQAVVDFCYTIDERTGDLFRVAQDGSQFAVIGEIAECRVEAIAYDRIGALWAFDAATAAFYTLNLPSGASILQWSGVSGTRSDNGMVHQVVDVDAMDFDAYDSRILWCVERIAGPSPDLLFSIDVTTGMIVGGMLHPVTGLGIGYDIEDIGINPLTNEMVGIANNDGIGDHLISISTNPPTVGNATVIGNLLTSGGVEINDMEGFGYDIDGRLIGTTGRCGNPAGSLFAIGADGTSTLLTTMSECGDFESIACFNARIVIDPDPDPNPDPDPRDCIDDCPLLSSCNDGCDEGFVNPTLTITSGACTMVVVSGPCPDGSSLEYSLDQLSWSTTPPTANAGMSAVISVRCSCDTDASVVSAPVSGAIDPDACIDIEVLNLNLEPIPTLSEWGIIILGLFLFMFGVVAVYNKKYSYSMHDIQ